MAILFVLIGYADSPGKPVRKFLMGFAHWAGHLTMAVLLYFLLRGLSESIPLRVGEIYNPIAPEGWKMTPEFMRFVHYLLFPLLMWFIGGLFAGAVWGTYLTISSFFRRHCDEAFSSMRITDFRHFLRLKIEPDKLTIYPIGLKNVPSRGQWRLADLDRDGVLMGPEFLPPKPFKPVLIDEPIVIDPNKVRGRDPLTRQVRKLEVASNQ